MCETTNHDCGWCWLDWLLNTAKPLDAKMLVSNFHGDHISRTSLMLMTMMMERVVSLSLALYFQFLFSVFDFASRLFSLSFGMCGGGGNGGESFHKNRFVCRADDLSLRVSFDVELTKWWSSHKPNVNDETIFFLYSFFLHFFRMAKKNVRRTDTLLFAVCEYIFTLWIFFFIFVLPFGASVLSFGARVARISQCIFQYNIHFDQFRSAVQWRGRVQALALDLVFVTVTVTERSRNTIFFARSLACLFVASRQRQVQPASHSISQSARDEMIFMFLLNFHSEIYEIIPSSMCNLCNLTGNVFRSFAFLAFRSRAIPRIRSLCFCRVAQCARNESTNRVLCDVDTLL